ncbi:MAG: DNA ligase D [Agriterribacter sp.]
MPNIATRKKSKTTTRKRIASNRDSLNGWMSKLPKVAFPKKVSPMLATLVDEPFNEEGWVYEIKWDGYRAVALCNKGNVALMSRNQKSFNEKFYPIYEAVKKWKLEGVVDGEICVINKEGLADFGALQNWRSETDGDLVYYVFDLIYYKGRDLSELPLHERRSVLQKILPKDDRIRFSENFSTSAKEFLNAASELGMEGIIAKKQDSVYLKGERTKTWLKIKAGKRHEVVIGGYTNNDNSPKLFSALLVGVYNKKKLVYTGKIGTGFNDDLQRTMMQQFEPLITSQCPFTETPDVNKPSRFRPNPPDATVTWLKPKLVCEVKYAEITSDGVMRHPSFEGMRIDKPANKVTEEKPEPLAEVLPSRKRKKVTSMIKKPEGGNSKTLLNPSEKTQVKKLNGHELSFTNLSKIYWPGEKITKRDMLNYYFQVAPYILPYLIDRPQSLNRYPNGINGKSFYQKDVTGKAPDWVKTFPYRTSEGEDKKFMVPQNEADLLYMANLGAIEMNPWNSTIHKPEFPTWCLIDLDPDKGNSFEQVIRTAQQVKLVLDELGIAGYAKTSGSTGIHVYIPLGEKYNYDHCQLFAKLIATHVHERLPDFTSIERLTRNRKGKIYVDYLQNRPKATLAAPYSVRPKPGATVSMPLHWDEIKKGLKMSQFTIKNALERIKREGDLFKPVLGKGVNLKQLLAKLE